MGQTEAFDLLDNHFEGQLQNLFGSLEVDEAKGTCELRCVVNQ